MELQKTSEAVRVCSNTGTLGSGNWKKQKKKKRKINKKCFGFSENHIEIELLRENDSNIEVLQVYYFSLGVFRFPAFVSEEKVIRQVWHLKLQNNPVFKSILHFLEHLPLQDTHVSDH
jgi:hypothetical protein